MAASPQPFRETDRVNNFDLIRLFGAAQVAVSHGIEHLRAETLFPLYHALGYVPGVPIFFAVSGFLVSLSWERAPNWRQYALNRALRIYPALWTALLVSVVILLACGVRPDSTRSFAIWIIAQLTIVQFYNPAFIRGFGVGVINGSAWTIPVEIQFYALVPFLAWLAKGKANRWWLLALASGCVMLVIRWVEQDPSSVLVRLVTVTLPPWLFFFLVGTALRYLHGRFATFLRGRAVFWAVLYGFWVAVEIAFNVPEATGNELNPVSILLLSALTISAAFTFPRIASRVLRENDISYGVYIYHMPFVNLFLFLGFQGTSALSLAIGVTVITAILSWRFVERPALALKSYSIRGRTNRLTRGLIQTRFGRIEEGGSGSVAPKEEAARR